MSVCLCVYVCKCGYDNSKNNGSSSLKLESTVVYGSSSLSNLLSAAERRGTPVLLSTSVSDNLGNSPQMAAPRRSREIDQSTQRFHVGYDNDVYLAMNMVD